MGKIEIGKFESEIQKYQDSGWQIVSQDGMAVAYSEHGSCVVISADGKTRHYENVPGKYQKLIAIWNKPLKVVVDGKKMIFRKKHWDESYLDWEEVGIVKDSGKKWCLLKSGKKCYAFPCSEMKSAA